STKDHVLEGKFADKINSLPFFKYYYRQTKESLSSINTALREIGELALAGDILRTHVALQEVTAESFVPNSVQSLADNVTSFDFENEHTVIHNLTKYSRPI